MSNNNNNNNNNNNKNKDKDKDKDKNDDNDKPKPPKIVRNRKRKLDISQPPNKKVKENTPQDKPKITIKFISKDGDNQDELDFSKFLTPILFGYGPNQSENENENEELNYYPDDSCDEDDVEDSCWDYQTINTKIDTIDDLINLGKIYNPLEKINYNINLRILNQLIEPLSMLNKMIGMKKVKKTVVEQIVYYLQDINDVNNDFLHSVIEGPPGVGKTEVAKILAKIYNKMEILTSDKIKIVKRSDLIGGYLGQTAIKTQKILDECNGGVLFIDEAYSLGNSEGKDSYSKECIDTLTAYLSENKSNFICIIAGYKEALKTCFFKYNEGLERRFPYRFQIEKYTPEELKEIFIKIVKENNWHFMDENEISTDFFKKNMDYFVYNGGDMEILFHKCKISHSKRVFCLPRDIKKKLIMEDIENGFELYLNNDEISNRVNNDMPNLNMYT